MNENFKKQLLNDFSISEEELLSKDNIFSVNKANPTFFYNNRGPLAIIFINNKILLRSENKDLVKILERKYKDYDGAWFAEASNIYKFNDIISGFDMKINNFFPIMTPPNNFHIEKCPFKYEFIYDDFDRFKNITDMAFSFDGGEFLGLSIYDEKKLIFLAGANKNSKYLTTIGVEKFDHDKKYKGIGTLAFKILCQELKDNFPQISPVYTTQFSHTKSMNLALRADFKIYSCLTADYKK